MRIITSPLVQLGLNLQYPPLGPVQSRLSRCVGIHPRPPGIPLSSLLTCWSPSPCARLSRARTTTRPPPHPTRSADDVPIPPTRMDSRQREPRGMISVFTANRLISVASSCARQPRREYAAALPRSLPTGIVNRLQSQPAITVGCALHPGPYPPDLSRCHAYGALPLVPLVYHLISLVGPGLSGSAKPSRLCQRCLPSSPASPESDCAQLLPSCCGSSTRRSCTSFGSQRLTAHCDFMAQDEDLDVFGRGAASE
jgi:hypothetical protein